MSNTKNHPTSLDGKAIAKMRAEGATWLAIAIHFQCSIGGAQKACNRYIESLCR